MIEPENARHWQAIADSLVEKAGADDPETFAFFVRLLDTTRERLRESAASLRGPLPVGGDGRTVRGFSWEDIARPLGVSKQAAMKRFGARG
jgi:hypothetical protein